LEATVASLKTQGVTVYTYPLTVSLVSPARTLASGFGFTLTGPPALYSILSSTDLATWSTPVSLNNTLGAVAFTDPAATNWPQKFYRARFGP
jgi:hypothetical protein